MAKEYTHYGNNSYNIYSSAAIVSVRDYYCYRLQTRPAKFNPILHGGRLFQQFAVDMYIKIEGCRLDWYRDHQTEIHADLYKGIVDSITAGESQGSAVGKRTVLPAKFQGCYRDMKKRHMDAMTLVQAYSKHDIFLTMTCNPNWQEILDNLLPGQTPQDRPDLIAHVFRAKLERMKEMLLKSHILPINISGSHWYLAVINARKRLVQVLDSLRTGMSRSDLTLLVSGY
jgi:hypothetical protein